MNMKCPNCGRTLNAHFMPKDSIITENFCEVSTAGSCPHCDKFFTWKTIIHSDGNIIESELSEFRFC